jgi:hypothetical protein
VVYNDDDYADWRENFGVTAGTASTSASLLEMAVPEPMPVLMMAIGSVCLAGTWRARKTKPQEHFANTTA